MATMGMTRLAERSMSRLQGQTHSKMCRMLVARSISDRRGVVKN